MDIETIYAAILAAAPSITAIVGIIGAVIKMKSSQTEKLGEVMQKFENLRDQVLETKQYEDLKKQLLVAHQENRELRKQINELLTKIDRIRRDEDAE